MGLEEGVFIVILQVPFFNSSNKFFQFYNNFRDPGIPILSPLSQTVQSDETALMCQLMGLHVSLLSKPFITIFTDVRSFTSMYSHMSLIISTG